MDEEHKNYKENVPYMLPVLQPLERKGREKENWREKGKVMFDSPTV